MIKYSKGCEGSVELQAALSSILGILKAVNDSMHLIAITGYEVKHICTHNSHLTHYCSLMFLSLLFISRYSKQWSLIPSRVTLETWVACWCRGRSACGRSIREVTWRWWSLPGLSPCRDTCSCIRKLCSSARDERRAERDTRKHPHIASNRSSA